MEQPGDGLWTAALIPAYRRLMPCQIDDREAMERLGVRLDAYSRLNLPSAMVSAVAAVLPEGERVMLSGQGHGGHARDPKQLADVIETFAGRVFA